MTLRGWPWPRETWGKYAPWLAEKVDKFDVAAFEARGAYWMALGDIERARATPSIESHLAWRSAVIEAYKLIETS